MIGWAFDQEFSPAGAQHAELAFEPVVAIWSVVVGSAWIS
jgi:hypothetical protein